MEITEQMTAVALVLALLGGTLWWLRRRGFVGLTLRGNRAISRMQCLERLPLGTQHTLHLVRVGDMELLLASSPAGCALIEALPRRKALP
ncbi:MAG TPA: flagellar biosynthetic protein FliO [Candidatus Acidoferrales bacterium]|nr:flagellar biosynthetic protein FliO [Candidatus Acidoferrales bacterium]